MKNLLLLVTILAWLSGCGVAPSPQNGNPDWIDRLIVRFQTEPVGNPPRSIYRYEYKGQIVYYVPAQCCDQFSTLYDSQGHVLCAPDGGITGKGDDTCPDFGTERKNEQLIWLDPRSRKE
jgi:hypothetical protein